MDLLLMISLLLLLLLCITSSAATSYDRMAPTSLQPAHSDSDSARRVQEEAGGGEFIQREVDALLSFKKSITSDPWGKLSTWTADNAHNICSWHGIRCTHDHHTTRRVVAIDLHVDLDVYEGYLEGTVSSSLGSLSSLATLNLSGNSFSGRIPPELGHLKALRLLDLSLNLMNGSIPVELGQLKALRVLDLSWNDMNGSIPVELGLLQKLEHLILDGNDFSGNIPRQLGEIPLSIGSMNSLRLLNLSGNRLEGEIPACLGEISTLEELILAKNNLHGEIPQELSKLSMLASLNVSFNNLCGPIPKGTQFYTFNVSSFQWNKCLCGFPLPPCKQKDKSMDGDNDRGSNVKRGWLSHVNEEVSLIALELGAGIGFGGVVAMFIAWDRARCWVLGLPPNSTRKPFYGLYRFPT